MDSVFFQSMLVQPPKILGRQLHHFSSYHALLLMLLDNPFFIGGRPTRNDAIELIWICGMEYQDGSQSIFDDRIVKDAFKWGKKTGVFDTDQVIEDVSIYLADYMAFPRLWSKEIGVRESHVPVPFRIVATVLSGYPSFTEAEVWNMPMIRAACYRACVAEDNGMEVVSASTNNIIDTLKEQGLEWKVDPKKVN